jgi:hypothetical protein
VGHVVRTAEKCIQGFGGEIGRHHLEDHGRDEKIILKWIKNRLGEGVI